MEDMELQNHVAAQRVISQLSPEIQSLSFQPDADWGSYMLLEVTNEMLAGIERGETFVVKGEPEKSAVLCSVSDTYSIKLRETSNKQLISPDVVINDTAAGIAGPTYYVERKISGIYSSHLEIKKIVPKYEGVRKLLEQSPYDGEEHEAGAASLPKFTFEDLVERVQISESELRDYLNNSHNFCQIDGFWRLITSSYTSRVIEKVYAWISSNGFNPDSVAADEAVNALLSEPEEITSEFFWPKFATSDGDVVRLRPDAVSRHFANDLLRTAKKMRWSEFLTVWQDAVRPFGIDVKEDYLAGVAFIDGKHSALPDVVYFPAEALPYNLEDRFRAIFRQKKMWKLEEIVPYVDDLVQDMDVEKVVSQYTKKYMENGTTFLLLGNIM